MRAPEQKIWEVQDRFGNAIYLTEERWRHIADGHPEMVGYEDQLTAAVRHGKRTQERADPERYRYRWPCDGLPNGNTHIVAIVRFSFRANEGSRIEANNFVVTAYQVNMGDKS